MVPTKLVQILQDSRWHPYLLGCLAGVPITVVMLQVWKNWDYLAWTWLILYGLVGIGGARVFWKSPTRKLISTAVFVGTFVPFLIR